MSLKMLSGFQKFDAERFFKEKQFLFTKLEEWNEGEDAEHMRTVGTKVTGVIFVDMVMTLKVLTRANQSPLRFVNQFLVLITGRFFKLHSSLINLTKLLSGVIFEINYL